MFGNGEKTVDVGGFPIPESQAEAFRELREKMAVAAAEVLAEFCVKVERKEVDPVLGEGVIGYDKDGEEEAKVTLDPFEVPAMAVAVERGKLLEYIIAANGLNMEYYNYKKEQLAQMR